MERLSLPKRFVIFDTEFTTWEGALCRGWNGPGECREVVQIGAVIVDGDSLREESAFTCLVRPVKNQQLSQYFVDLTGITQQRVDAEGLSYQDALTQFANWSEGLPLYCWGMDLEIMAYNATFTNCAFPLELSRKKDVRSLFELEGIATSGYMSSTIMRAFGEESPLAGHDGLNDARSILQALRALRHRLSP